MVNLQVNEADFRKVIKNECDVKMDQFIVVDQVVSCVLISA